MCKVPAEQGIAKATLSMMVKSTANDMQAARLGLRTVLPENMSIDLDITGGLARIDLGEEALTMADAAAESNMITAIVQALTEFPTVEKVEFLIDGPAHGGASARHGRVRPVHPRRYQPGNGLRRDFRGGRKACHALLPRPRREACWFR